MTDTANVKAEARATDWERHCEREEVLHRVAQEALEDLARRFVNERAAHREAMEARARGAEEIRRLDDLRCKLRLLLEDARAAILAAHYRKEPKHRRRPRGNCHECLLVLRIDELREEARPR
ncbi:MAG: hypothetical protein ACRD1X_12455 [Vicinamibacteria bacterium]